MMTATARERRRVALVAALQSQPAAAGRPWFVLPWPLARAAAGQAGLKAEPQGAGR